ncbi:hypothetical protein RintRC_0690 [Richelia intracellularis]|nr:hypothetical protein RintRC_0690 [Richelia intracellularis]
MVHTPVIIFISSIIFSHSIIFPTKKYWALLNQGMISLNLQRFLNGFKR